MIQPSNLWPVSAAKPPTCLTFAPLAWLKLQFFCHAGDTEIGGFGIASEQDLLYVEDFVTVRQRVTPVTVRFDDAGVADFFDDCVDRGLRVEQFSRLWMHTHPAASVEPSQTDETTFAQCFGRCDWSLMFILGRTAQTYARLAYSVGPPTQLLIPTVVDWSVWPAGLESATGWLDKHVASWQAEYERNIEPVSPPMWPLPSAQDPRRDDPWADYPYCPELDEVTYASVLDFPADQRGDAFPRPRPPAA